VDINLSSSDDEAEHLPMPVAPVDQKMSGDDDTGDVGVTSPEPTALGPMGSGVPKKSKPSATDQALTIPPSGRHG
jgi:hypothetical protein